MDPPRSVTIGEPHRLIHKADMRVTQTLYSWHHHPPAWRPIIQWIGCVPLNYLAQVSHLVGARQSQILIPDLLNSFIEGLQVVSRSVLSANAVFTVTLDGIAHFLSNIGVPQRVFYVVAEAVKLHASASDPDRTLENA